MTTKNTKTQIINPLKQMIKKEKENNTQQATITKIKDKQLTLSLKQATTLKNNTLIQINHIEAQITKNNYKNIEVKLKKTDPNLKVGSEITIRNSQNEIITKKLENIITLIEENKINQSNQQTLELFTNKIVQEYANEGFHKANLNINQNVAVQKALNTPKFHLIQGPPGTGKTHTIVEIVKQLTKRNKKILICTHTHIALDNVVEKLGDITDDKILRLGLDNKISENNLKYSMNAHLKRMDEYKEIKKREDEIHAIRKGKRMENLHMPTSNELFISKLLRCIFKLPKTTNIKDKSIINHTIYELNSEIKSIKKKLEAQIVEDAQIIATTVISASSYHTSDIEFDYLIMDEASQVPVYLALIPLLKCDKFILIGDNKQLEPIANNNATVFLNKSIFSALIEMYPDYYTFLNVQYRMHEDICRLSSNLYYDGLLKSGSKTKYNKLYVKDDYILISDNPVTFINTGGVNFHEESTSSGCFNKYEADIILSIIYELICNGISSYDIGVISPYRCQKLYLKKLLAKHEFGSVEVDTIYRFQGREKKVIILSFCKSNTGSLSKFQENFLSDKNQLNVSLTRATSSLIIVGDLDFLMSARNIRDLKFMIGQENIIHLFDMIG